MQERRKSLYKSRVVADEDGASRLENSTLFRPFYSLLWSKWFLHGEEGVGREKKKEKRRRVFHGWVSRKWKGEVVRAARGHGPGSLGRT
jgi:hypothetical protein